MTLSYYYKDPDGNHVELQVDVFGDWEASREWMRTSPDFHANPIGVFVEPGADRRRGGRRGASFEDIHARAMARRAEPVAAADRDARGRTSDATGEPDRRR